MLGSDLTQALGDVLPEPLLLISPHGEILHCNRVARRLFPGLAAGATLSDLIVGNDSKLAATLQLWLRNGSFIRGLIKLVNHAGERFIAYGARLSTSPGTRSHIVVRCQPENQANGQFTEITRRVNALNREISRRQHVEAQLFAEKELAQVTLHSIGDAVITTDTEGLINYLNPIAEALTGWSEQEARGRPVAEVFQIFHEHTREPAEIPVDRVLAHGAIVGLANHTVLMHRDGTEFAIDDSAAPIHDRSGQLIGVVMVFHDVTHARKLAAEISHQASHDSLTGLLNRQSFERRLRNLLDAPGAMDNSHSLMFLDLDQFKVINDTCGHLAGDSLLRALGPVLQGHLRHSDILARLGGDEFGVLLQDCPTPVAERIAQGLREAVQDFSFIWDGKPFTIGVSIGQVNFGDNSWSLADLLNAADNACYVAKENGRNRVHVYRSDDQELAYRFRQAQWVGRIRQAFLQDQFRLHAQLIVPISPLAKQSDDEGVHFEVLLRLNDDDGKLVPPMAFIPAAERYNLMVSIDRWVIETAFRKLSSRDCTIISTCSINLSGDSLGDDEFLPFVKQCFERFGIPPRMICFEITETVAIANLANARVIIDALSAFGCRFSLDDFGSGMSSFGYLKNLPVHYLKIDGTFIKDMAHDLIDHAMVAAINNIGHVMGLQTVAEFVVAPPVLQELRELGVDYAQGFGIAKPEPLDALLARLDSIDRPAESGQS